MQIREAWALAAAILAGAAPAQRGPALPPGTAAEGALYGFDRSSGVQERLEDFRTKDGSRILLVPLEGPPLVHWVVATPAGVLEDPPGLEGLSYAVARAALLGTSLSASSEPAAEQAALTELDRLEQDRDRLLATGRELPEDTRLGLEQARARAQALHDGLAWQRALRRVPAGGVELHQSPAGMVLELTTVPGGIPRVAQLLLERREGQVLRGVAQELRRVRAGLDAERRGPVAEMRREVLGLCYLGHALSRALAPTDAPAPVSQRQALEVFQRTHHPIRTVHVLAGGFDPATVRAQLERVLAHTALPPVTMPTAPPSLPSSAERRSRIPAGPYSAVTIGYRVPEGADAEAVTILVRWLASGDDSELAQRLRLRGHPEAKTHGMAPFPAPGGGLLLLEVEDAPRDDGIAQDLGAAVEACLEEALRDGPKSKDWQQAVARTRAEGALARLAPSSLALQLALGVGLAGREPRAVLRDAEGPDPDALTLLARQVLSPNARAIVVMEALR